MDREDEFNEDESGLGATSLIDFPPEVQSAIEQVLPSDDPLDQPDFDPVNYINSLFPTEQSLASIDEVVSRMEAKILGIDEEIRAVVRGQTNMGQDGRAALAESQRVIAQLFLQIRDIKARAEQSEAAVQQITRDIKQLDCAKRNLTAAITSLNHLHMLAQGVDSLKALTKKRMYGEIVMPLQGVQQVMNHFQHFTDIPQIRDMAEQVRQIHVELERQITADFHEAFEGPNAKHFTPSRQLAEACLVVSVLDPRVKAELLGWLADLQLAEYKLLFAESQELGWLDKVDRRYSWLKKHLIEFEDKFGPMFPPDWELSERIAVRFCAVTRTQLSQAMARRRDEIDVKLLLYAIQRTAAFENLLAQRFSGTTLTPTGENAPAHQMRPLSTNPFEEDEPKGSNPFEEESAASKVQAKPVAPFQSQIGQCFEPYLNIYIESIDRNLSELMDQFVQEARNAHPPMVTEGGAGCAVLPSCADLFVFYKKCLVQCAQLSTSQPMLNLAAMFQKNLREYAIQLLTLPKMAHRAGIRSSWLWRHILIENSEEGVQYICRHCRRQIPSWAGIKTGHNHFRANENCRILRDAAEAIFQAQAAANGQNHQRGRIEIQPAQAQRVANEVPVAVQGDVHLGPAPPRGRRARQAPPQPGPAPPDQVIAPQRVLRPDNVHNGHAEAPNLVDVAAEHPHPVAAEVAVPPRPGPRLGGEARHAPNPNPADVGVIAAAPEALHHGRRQELQGPADHQAQPALMAPVNNFRGGAILNLTNWNHCRVNFPARLFQGPNNQ